MKIKYNKCWRPEAEEPNFLSVMISLCHGIRGLLSEWQHCLKALKPSSLGAHLPYLSCNIQTYIWEHHVLSLLSYSSCYCSYSYFMKADKRDA